MERYSAYRQSGIEWLGKIPEHWEERRFVFLFSFSRGLPISKQDLKEKGVPCVNYGEIHSKFGFEVNPEINTLKCVDEKYLSISNNSLLSQGDIIFADTSEDIQGSGNFTCLEGNIPTFAGYHTIIAKQKKNEHYRFLAYYFDSVEYRTQIRSQVRGIKVFSITQDILKSTKVLLPPLPEQEAIASFLDRKTKLIDDLIAMKERLIELKKEERVAIINQAVTKGLDSDVPMKDSRIEWLGEIPEHWDKLSMKHVCQFILDGTHGSYKRVDNGYRLLSVRNIIDDEFVFRDDDSKVSEIDFNEISNRFLIKKGDVQLAIVGATIGKVALVRILPELFVTQRSVATLRVNNICLAEYLFYFIKTSHFQSFLWLHAGFSAQPGIYLGTIQNCPMPMPCIAIQKKIVAYLDKHKDQYLQDIRRATKQINLLKEYKTTLISEAVTGKIRVH